jgi:sugar phosphate isomerase/epimerase
MLTGISTLVDLEIPLPRLFDMIAASGFTHVSLSHDVKHSEYHTAEGRAMIKRLLRANGLKLDYIHPPIEVYFDLTSLDHNVRKLSVEMLRMPIDACAELGGRSLTLHVCNERRIAPDQIERRAEVGAAALAEVVEYAATRDVLICVENLPGYYAAQQVTMALLRRADSKGAWVTLDANHAWVDNDDPKALVSELAPRVRTTHFSDTMGRYDSHLLPGEGIVDYRFVAEELASHGFGPGRGDVIDLECSVWMQRKRAGRGEPHPGDPGYNTDGSRPDPNRVPGHRHSPMPTSEYLMVAHYEATRIGEWIESAVVGTVPK